MYADKYEGGRRKELQVDYPFVKKIKQLMVEMNISSLEVDALGKE